MSVKKPFQNTYTLHSVWEEMCNRCWADERGAWGGGREKSGEDRGTARGENPTSGASSAKGNKVIAMKNKQTYFLIFFFFQKYNSKRDQNSTLLFLSLNLN